MIHGYLCALCGLRDNPAFRDAINPFNCGGSIPKKEARKSVEIYRLVKPCRKISA